MLYFRYTHSSVALDTFYVDNTLFVFSKTIPVNACISLSVLSANSGAFMCRKTVEIKSI